jgi:hypothetical protein
VPCFCVYELCLQCEEISIELDSIVPASLKTPISPKVLFLLIAEMNFSLIFGNQNLIDVMPYIYSLFGFSVEAKFCFLVTF